eukprot:gene4342-2297_t
MASANLPVSVGIPVSVDILMASEAPPNEQGSAALSPLQKARLIKSTGDRAGDFAQKSTSQGSDPSLGEQQSSVEPSGDLAQKSTGVLSEPAVLLSQGSDPSQGAPDDGDLPQMSEPAAPLSQGSDPSQGQQQSTVDLSGPPLLESDPQDSYTIPPSKRINVLPADQQDVARNQQGVVLAPFVPPPQLQVEDTFETQNLRSSMQEPASEVASPMAATGTGSQNKRGKARWRSKLSSDVPSPPQVQVQVEDLTPFETQNLRSSVQEPASEIASPIAATGAGFQNKLAKAHNVKGSPTGSAKTLRQSKLDRIKLVQKMFKPAFSPGPIQDSIGGSSRGDTDSPAPGQAEIPQAVALNPTFASENLPIDLSPVNLESSRSFSGDLDGPPTLLAPEKLEDPHSVVSDTKQYNPTSSAPMPKLALQRPEP